MKKFRLALFFLIILTIVLGSCKKINEPTELGGNLIPGVDNIHTFELLLPTFTNNALFNDTTRLNYRDNVALGSLNDPVFGQTNADVYFSLSSASYGSYPFIVSRTYADNPDSLAIDSVVLSLAYTGAYGDTNAQQTIHVYEIDKDPEWQRDSLYKFNAAPFQTTGTELGSKTFTVNTLNDSFTVLNKIGDTARLANVLRIKFNNTALAQRLADFDTTSTSSNGGFANDSLFRTLFSGLALKTDAPSGSGTLTYFNLSDVTNTKLIVYIRATKGGVTDTTTVSFVHSNNGQANLIKRTPAGDYANYLANGPGPDDKIYIQSQPGSYAAIKIPGLDTLSNKVIHRAELVAYRLPSAQDDIFTPPSRLIVDRVNAAGDSAFLLQNDIIASATGTVSFSTFGGTLGSDNTYHLNITRYVQELITKHTTNDTLRLYAPLRTDLFASNLNRVISVPVLSQVANGRVVLAGGSYADTALQFKLRIIYSNL